jgi:hypothetical protein
MDFLGIRSVNAEKKRHPFGLVARMRGVAAGVRAFAKELQQLDRFGREIVFQAALVSLD